MLLMRTGSGFSFYNRNFIVEKLSEGSKEITLECRIRIKGEERLVRNVLMRGEKNDGSRYAMILSGILQMPEKKWKTYWS